MNSLARWIRKSPCKFTRVGWICVSCMHKIQEKQQQWYIPTLRTPTPPGRRRCPVPRSARHSWRSGAHRAPSCCRKCVDGFVRRDLRWLRWGLFILFDVCLFFVVVLEFFWNKSVSFWRVVCFGLECEIIFIYILYSVISYVPRDKFFY